MVNNHDPSEYRTNMTIHIGVMFHCFVFVLFCNRVSTIPVWPGTHYVA
jgi:hypothetical protein